MSDEDISPEIKDRLKKKIIPFQLLVLGAQQAKANLEDKYLISQKKNKIVRFDVTMNKFVLESEEPSADPEKNTDFKCTKEGDGWFRINLTDQDHDQDEEY